MAYFLKKFQSIHLNSYILLSANHDLHEGNMERNDQGATAEALSRVGELHLLQKQGSAAQHLRRWRMLSAERGIALLLMERG